ncbi:MAG: hypothetical protein ABIS50_04580 [Luteolibacter sp.]|uniref:hypothetical protein n=1 Tax=Luteolibacter sp. TaxID=1962973 RepID=UPI0032644770
MTREKLLVELHLLDHWSSEAEERLTNESNEMTLPNGEKWNRRSYRAEGYDGVKFIHVMIGENHDLKSVVVQSGDRIDGYRWADGAFLKNPPPLTNMKIPRRSTGVKRWIQDFFNLFGDG